MNVRLWSGRMLGDLSEKHESRFVATVNPEAHMKPEATLFFFVSSAAPYFYQQIKRINTK